MTNKQRKARQRTTLAIENGSARGNVIRNGQWRYCNVYCPECHAFNNMPHRIGCHGKKIRINPTARIPKKDATKKIWDRFYEKFVKCHPYKQYDSLLWKE